MQANIKGFSYKNILNVWAVVAFLMFTLVLLFLSRDSKLALPILGFTAALPFFALIIKYPKIWLWTIAISSFEFFRTSDIKIGVGDILFGIFIIASTYIWLIWKLLIQREKIIESIADWFIILFYIGMLLNSVIALSNNVLFISWFREFALFSNILLYFPLKYYLESKKDIIILLTLFSFSVLFSAADQIRMYKQIALQQTVYAYQLGSSVRLNQPLFTAAIFFSLLMSLLPMKQIYRLMLWGLTLISTAALIVSFSRSFWVLVMFGVVLTFFYLGRKQKKILVIALSLIMLAGSVSFFTFFQEKADLMIQVLTHRLTSTTKGKKDLSYKIRLLEYTAVLKKIEENPWYGNGMGKKFHFYVANLHFTTYTPYIHNGYLYTMYRLGIPLTFIFLFILGYNIFLSRKLSKKINSLFYKHLLLSVMISLLMLAISSLTANQFFQRDSGMIMALSFAFISIVQKKYKQKLIT